MAVRQQVSGPGWAASGHWPACAVLWLSCLAAEGLHVTTLFLDDQLLLERRLQLK